MDINLKDNYKSLNSSQDDQNKGDEFIQLLVEKLGTLLAQPEEAILNQGEKSNDLYFISSGDCVIKQQDHNNYTHLFMKLLTEGDVFGEISVIYQCERTTTIICRNYNQIARLTYASYRSITN